MFFFNKYFTFSVKVKHVFYFQLMFLCEKLYIRWEIYEYKNVNVIVSFRCINSCPFDVLENSIKVHAGS